MIVCRQCGTANESDHIRCKKCGESLHAAHMVGKIPCQVHANREATTTCNGCGARLCDACAYTLGGIDFCENCAPEGAISTEHDEDYERIPVVDSVHTEHAPFGNRFLAGLIDLAILVAGAGILEMIAAIFGRPTIPFAVTSAPVGFWIFWGLLFVGGILYQSIMTAMTGQTVGKQLTGVIVLGPDGRILSLTASIQRTLATIVSLLPLGLGCLWALWDPRQETWHDKISKTVAYQYVDVR